MSAETYLNVDLSLYLTPEIVSFIIYEKAHCKLYIICYTKFDKSFKHIKSNNHWYQHVVKLLASILKHTTALTFEYILMVYFAI